MAVIIGTSGWQYRDWRGAFYPPKLPQRLWLEHYAEHFATVESNNAFYRLPELRDLREVARAHPAGLPLGGQGQPLPHPHQAAARARGAGRPADGPRRRARRQARHDPAAAAAHAEGRRRPAPRLPRRSSRPARGSPSNRGTRAGGPTRSGRCSSATARRCAGPTATRSRSPRCGGPPTGAICASTTASRPGRYRPETLQLWADRLAATWGPDEDVLVYFNNDPGCAAVADAVVFADAVRRAGGTPTRVPTAEQATGLAWGPTRRPRVSTRLEDGVLGVPDAELLGRLAAGSSARRGCRPAASPRSRCARRAGTRSPRSARARSPRPAAGG